ncbi:MAG: mechanosensitive ion channel family protein [Panacibacter sp.]
MKETKSFTSGVLDSLTNYWNHFLSAMPRIGLAIIIFLIIFFVAVYIARLINKKLAGDNNDPLFVKFISKITKTVIIICGIILSLQTLGLSGVASGLLAGAGISAFVFGFAFKDIAENFLAGIILAFNRPFSLNDTVTINGFSGHVIALNFRTTHIKTFDEKDVFIPNAIVIKEPLTNLTRDGKIRLDFVVGIAYEDNIANAIETILKVFNETDDHIKEKKPFAVVEELAVSTVNIRVYFWTNTMDYKKGVLQIKSEVIKNVKELLTEKGFSLPADIQEFKLYDKKEPLPINILNIKDAIKK